jgi:hypothetical protein
MRPLPSSTSAFMNPRVSFRSMATDLHFFRIWQASDDMNAGDLAFGDPIIAARAKAERGVDGAENSEVDQFGRRVVPMDSPKRTSHEAGHRSLFIAGSQGGRDTKNLALWRSCL